MVLCYFSFFAGLQLICSITSFCKTLMTSGVRASTALWTWGSTIEYIRLFPSFLHRINPVSLRILRWRDTTGWIRLKCGIISQTHFSPSRRYSSISSRSGDESAWKICALKRCCDWDMASREVYNNI